MGDLGEQLNALNEDQKQAVRAYATTAVETAKLDFRAGVAGSRRPNTFDPSTTTIQAYFDMYEPFRYIMCMNGQQAVSTFLTYLDSKSLNLLVDKELTTEDDWDTFKAEVIKALSTPSVAVKARFEIKKATQFHDETVVQFGQRLLDLGKVGYDANQLAARDSVLKDALSAGVLRDDLSMILINLSDKSFQELLAEAVKLDSSYQARQAIKAHDKIEVSVMKTELDATEKFDQEYFQAPVMYTSRGRPQQNNWRDSRSNDSVQCYNCQKYGHFARSCHSRNNTFIPNQTVQGSHGISYENSSMRPVRCFICSQNGHYARNCGFKAVDDSSGPYQDGQQTNRNSQNFSRPDDYRQRSVQRGYYQPYAPRCPPFQNTAEGPQCENRSLQGRTQQAYNIALEHQQIEEQEHSRRYGSHNVGSRLAEVSSPATRNAEYLEQKQYNDQWSPHDLVNNERGVRCGAVLEEDIERQTINLCEGRVYLNVDINSVGVKALIDTGSSVNLIGEKLVEKLGLSKLVTEGTFKLFGVTGAPLHTLGILHNVAVIVKNAVLECDFIVTTMMNEACIIGQSFFSKHHIIIDFDSETVKNNEFVACLLEGTPSSNTLQVSIKQDTVVTEKDVSECAVNDNVTLDHIKPLAGSSNTIHIDMNIEIIESKVKKTSCYIKNSEYKDHENAASVVHQKEVGLESQNMIKTTPPVCIRVHSVTVNMCMFATPVDYNIMQDQEDNRSPANDLEQQRESCTKATSLSEDESLMKPNFNEDDPNQALQPSHGYILRSTVRRTD